MNTKDAVEKTLEAYNDVFADIVNVLLFDGKQIVTEDSLTDAQPFSYYKAYGKKVRSQERDVAKFWQNGHIRISFFGMENQTAPEKEMPLRVIGYDGAAYRAQISKRGHKKQGGRTEISYYPVITLVLYFGTEQHWSKPRSLKELVAVPAELSEYISDYKINVFELAWLTDEQIEMFRSDFKEVVLYLRAKRTDTEYRGTNQQLKHAEEILDLFSLMSDNDRYKDIKIDLLDEMEESRGGITMCNVTERLLNEGRAEGRIEGENALLSLFKKLYSLGRGNDVEKATNDREYLKKLMDEWQK